MQKEKNKQKLSGKKPPKDVFVVPEEYWDDLKKRDHDKLCEDSLARKHAPGGFLVRFLEEDVLVDTDSRCIRRSEEGQWEKINHPLLELIILVYLLNASSYSISHEMISVSDLKTAQFFQGPHELKKAPLLERYGYDLEGFKIAAENLRGEPMDLADAAYQFLPLPKIPLYYLLWEGDDEFGPNLSILFDRSIERHLSADAIWGLVNLISSALKKDRGFFENIRIV
jgi:hypothetical protein